MKALLIADNDLYIENISSVLKAAGYDTIVYKWLLKALDNVEEIAPHLIIVSTEEYPRHWKTLTQFAQYNFGDYTPQVILFTGRNFNEEEKKKADALGVRGCFDSVDVEGLDCLRNILKTKIDIYSGKLTEPENPLPLSLEAETAPEEKQEEKKQTLPCTFVFTNPVTGSIVSGRARNYDGNSLEYVADFEESLKAISKGTLVTSATLKTGEAIDKVHAEVISMNDDSLLLEIKKTA